ncbi:MAG: hypothetical protein KJ760_19085, partial [Proteobacteria bacterium]|nr:hypothetical protein [Pseudomonadota bacterium]
MKPKNELGLWSGIGLVAANMEKAGTFLPGNKQSKTGGICASITGILKNEIGKTKNKTKLDILKGGLKYANDVCDAGGAPDLAKITKGLPKKDKLRISQKTNSALFDGADPDLPDKNFGPAPSNQSPVSTGRGGQVLDLKAADPDLKTTPIPEFSLNGTKLNQTLESKSPILLASAASAKSPAGAAAPAKTAASATAQAQSLDATPDDTLYNTWKISNDLMCDLQTRILETGKNNSTVIPQQIAAGKISCGQGDFG